MFGPPTRPLNIYQIGRYEKLGTRVSDIVRILHEKLIDSLR